MARHMMQGDPLYILFDEEGESVFDSQNRPRMYKSVEAFQRAFPRGIDGVHLEKYIPSQTWISVKDEPPKQTFLLVWCEVAKCVDLGELLCNVVFDSWESIEENAKLKTVVGALSKWVIGND